MRRPIFRSFYHRSGRRSSPGERWARRHGLTILRIAFSVLFLSIYLTIILRLVTAGLDYGLIQVQ